MIRAREQRNQSQPPSPTSSQSSSQAYGEPLQIGNSTGVQEPMLANTTIQENGHMQCNSCRKNHMQGWEKGATASDRRTDQDQQRLPKCPKTLPISRKSWELLSETTDTVLVKIGEVPVVCEQILISTLYVGTHAVSNYITKGLNHLTQQGPHSKLSQYKHKPNRLRRMLSKKLRAKKGSLKHPKRPIKSPLYSNKSLSKCKPNYPITVLKTRSIYLHPNSKLDPNNHLFPISTKISPKKPISNTTKQMASSDEDFIAQFEAFSAGPSVNTPLSFGGSQP